jgi:hypothetical protein
MACNLSRAELKAFGIKFDNQLCQAIYRDKATNQTLICGKCASVFFLSPNSFEQDAYSQNIRFLIMVSFE